MYSQLHLPSDVIDGRTFASRETLQRRDIELAGREGRRGVVDRLRGLRFSDR